MALLSLLLITLILYYIYSVIFIIEYFVLFWFITISIFLQVMFFTTCERKALALIQRRVGPAIIGIRGRLQYLADSVKLLTKIFYGPRHISAAMFQGAAFVGFWISWLSFGNLTYGPGLDIVEIEYNIFFLISFSLAFGFVWLLAGWSATSRYSLLGCLRASVQIISFEVLVSLLLLIIFITTNSFNYEVIIDMQIYISLIFFIPVAAIIFFLAFFIEVNRPPFDLSEAESDVVAGYNVEYSGILFGLFYLGEYLNLFAACTLLTIIFCGGWISISYYYMFFYEIILFSLFI